MDLSADPAVVGARASKVWYGPVRYQHDSEPYVTVAVAGNLAAAGIAIADINLKLIWDVIAAIKIGDTGHTFVVGAGSGDFNRLKSIVSAANGSAVTTTGDV